MACVQRRLTASSTFVEPRLPHGRHGRIARGDGAARERRPASAHSREWLGGAGGSRVCLEGREVRIIASAGPPDAAGTVRHLGITSRRPRVSRSGCATVGRDVAALRHGHGQGVRLVVCLGDGYTSLTRAATIDRGVPEVAPSRGWLGYGRGGTSSEREGRLRMSDRSAIEWTEATWNPGDRVHEGLGGLRPLLRGDLRRAVARYPRPPVRARLRSAVLAPTA